MQADRAVVVSPRKSGTHLLQELMVCFGYHAYGESLPPAEGRVALSPRERMVLAERFLHPVELANLDWRADRDRFIQATDLLWTQVADMWQVKLAATNVSNTELAFPNLRYQLSMHPEAWRRPFSDTPTDVCWIFHSLDVWRLDQDFCREWQAGGPRLLLNYRDPRDTVLSMVNFLSGDSGHDFSRQPELAIFRPILRNIPDLADRITYVLRDPAIPVLSDFEAAISLFHHPQVCVVSFEELVGPQGGGTVAAQVAAVSRAAEHIQADADPDTVAGKLFNPKAYSFHRGQIGAWQDVFTIQHKRTFDARFGHLLEIFDYA
jgi:hypothetical protein